MGVNEATGQYHVEINGLAQPETPEATRICREDLNEVVTSFLQDKTVLERGLFDQENTIPEELTQLKMGKIVRERYPELSDADQEAIRQHAIAAMNVTQQANWHWPRRMPMAVLHKATPRFWMASANSSMYVTWISI